MRFLDQLDVERWVNVIWTKEFNAGNAAGIAALYAKDGVLLEPNREAAVGRAAIQARLVHLPRQDRPILVVRVR